MNALDASKLIQSSMVNASAHILAVLMKADQINVTTVVSD
jgi:hypothetical protein